MAKPIENGRKKKKEICIQSDQLRTEARRQTSAAGGEQQTAKKDGLRKKLMMAVKYAKIEKRKKYGRPKSSMKECSRRQLIDQQTP